MFFREEAARKPWVDFHSSFGEFAPHVPAVVRLILCAILFMSFLCEKN
jgi:hypothetical protein